MNVLKRLVNSLFKKKTKQIGFSEETSTYLANERMKEFILSVYSANQIREKLGL